MMCPKSQQLVWLRILNPDSGSLPQGYFFFVINSSVSRKSVSEPPENYLCHNYCSIVLYQSVARQENRSMPGSQLWDLVK